MRAAEKKTIVRASTRRRSFYSESRKSQMLSLPAAGEITTMYAETARGLTMERLNFEPFGERMAQEDALPQTSRASKLLLWAGSAVFWSLVTVIVLARAAFFNPDIFSSFDRLAALTGRASGLF
jgi:hypothetical protein